MNGASVEGKTGPLNMKPTSFLHLPPSSALHARSTCEEETSMTGGEKIQPKEKLGLKWHESEFEIEKGSPIVPRRTPPGLLSRKLNNNGSLLRSSMDQSPSCSQNPSHHQHTPLHPERGNSAPHVMPISNTEVSCDRCRPIFMSKESPPVIHMTELQEMIGLPQKNPSSNGNGLLKFFSRTKKTYPKKLNSTDKLTVNSSSPSIMEIVSIEGLKQKLTQASIRRDVALTEVVQLRSSMAELEKKLRKLELYCQDLKHALNQNAAEDGSSTTGPERPMQNFRIKAYNSRAVTCDTMVKCFLQIVAEARLAVRQLCRTLLILIQDLNDGKGLENLISLLEPYEIQVDSRISRGVMYYLEALLNQALYEEFESCNFHKNGVQEVLDPYESSNMNFSSFNTLRNLSWDDVVSKGTRFFSEGFSRFCDQKMGLIVSMLNWTSAWPEQLLQAFFTAAKCVWLVHLLAFSFHPPLVIFRVEKPIKFDSIYMEDILADRQSKQASASVRIMVMPGFYVHNNVIKCKVLCRYT